VRACVCARFWARISIHSVTSKQETEKS